MRDVQSKLPENRLRQLREQRGLKRYELAALIQVDPSTVYRWETGRVPDEAKLLLAAFYDVTPEYLMGWDRLNEGVAA